MTKKGWGSNNGENGRSRSRSRERVSLLGNRRDQNRRVASPPSSGNGVFARRRKQMDEEKVSLLGGPSPGKAKRSNLHRRSKGTQTNRWTMSRMMKYAAIFFVTSLFTYKMLRREAKIIHWDEYNNILKPGESKRCYEEDTPGKAKDKKKEKCLCGDPTTPMQNTENKLWKSNHDRMVHEAKTAPKDLDIVFFGDGIVEQLSGTRNLGKEMVNGMEDYFEKTFSRKRGGKFNAIALGSSGDTGPNLLWHWENGIQQANLRPKLWFIVVGGNDLYVNNCDDEYVMANVLNVAKRIFEDQPEAKIVVHGIFPRKDDVESKSHYLGHAWNRAQGINLDVRKFIKTHSSRILYMNLGQTLMKDGGMKGRRQVDPHMTEGLYPTSKGMQTWADLAAKKIRPILKGFDMEAHRKKKKKTDETNNGGTEDASNTR